MNSLDDFEERMKEIECLIDLIPEKPSSQNVKQINTLCRASIVLLSSHLEGFLQDLMEEFIDEVNRVKIVFKDLPIKLYIQNKFPNGKLTQNDLNNLEKIFTEIKILENSNMSITLDKNKFDKTEGNPTADVINKLFKIIGIDNVLDILNKEILNLDSEESYKNFFSEEEKIYLNEALGMPSVLDNIERYIVKKRNLKNPKKRNVGYYNTINQLLKYRNNIAHGNINANISLQELIKLKDDIVILVTNLSKKVDERLKELENSSSTIEKEVAATKQ